MVTSRKWLDPIVLAPPIFIAHFLEEAPTFVPWFNSHVARGITSGMFWRVNLTALVITLIVVAFEWFSRSELSLVLTIGWLGFLMFANGVFHVVGAIVDGGYVPGVITAALLYLPYYSWLFLRGVKSKRVAVPILVLVAIVAAIPMAVHGYLILFRGSRLF
jgi:hypothetical protein